MLHSMARCICSTVAPPSSTKPAAARRVPANPTRLRNCSWRSADGIADVGMGADHTQWLVIWATADHHAPAQYPFVVPACCAAELQLVMAMVAHPDGGKPGQCNGTVLRMQQIQPGGNGRATRRGRSQHVQPATQVLHPDLPSVPHAVASAFQRALRSEARCRAISGCASSARWRSIASRAIGSSHGRNSKPAITSSPSAPAPQTRA